MILKYFHENLKCISIGKDAGFLQKYLIYRGRNFVRKSCKRCRKYEGPPHQCPTTRSLTKLKLNDSFSFFTTGIDNFIPLYAKSISAVSNSSATLHKVTLCRCAISNRGATSEGEGGCFRFSFSKIGKYFPDFGKNSLIVLVYGLNFSFKMFFQKEKKQQN